MCPKTHKGTIRIKKHNVFGFPWWCRELPASKQIDQMPQCEAQKVGPERHKNTPSTSEWTLNSANVAGSPPAFQACLTFRNLESERFGKRQASSEHLEGFPPFFPPAEKPICSVGSSAKCCVPFLSLFFFRLKSAEFTVMVMAEGPCSAVYETSEAFVPVIALLGQSGTGIRGGWLGRKPSARDILEHLTLESQSWQGLQGSSSPILPQRRPYGSWELFHLILHLPRELWEL